MNMENLTPLTECPPIGTKCVVIKVDLDGTRQAVSIGDVVVIDELSTIPFCLKKEGSCSDWKRAAFLLSQLALLPEQYEEQTKSCLQEAAEIVGGSRAAEYGDQRVNFKKYADLATMMLDPSDLESITGGRITAPVVVKVLMAVKLGRHAFKPKRDNIVDLCGYSDILHTVQTGPKND